MSGYRELVSIGVTCRPFDGPPPPEGGRFSPFSASWTTTIELLADELRHLQAERVVVELGLEESDLRLDGLPRAGARMSSDAVRVSFDSKWGPLRYETGEFVGRWGTPGWQANIRAIALAMEALRKVDRYGVSKRGEQYRGWRQLEMGTDMTLGLHDAGQAREFLRQWAGETEGHDMEVLVRRAVKATHPDVHGGDDENFRRVMRAKELLGA